MEWELFLYNENSCLLAFLCKYDESKNWIVDSVSEAKTFDGIFLYLHKSITKNYYLRDPSWPTMNSYHGNTYNDPHPFW